jgi:hypothetical protein
MNEHDTFWVQCCIVEDILGPLLDATAPSEFVAIKLASVKWALEDLAPRILCKLADNAVSLQHFVLGEECVYVVFV